MVCKHGKLKNPVGGRRCRKRRSARRSNSRECKYGKLKRPSGGRRCKRRPHGVNPKLVLDWGPMQMSRYRRRRR